MLQALFLFLVLVAVAAWVVAVTTALQIAGLAPAGRRMNVWFLLGWWRFEKIRELTGDAARPYLRRYIAAFLAFFAAIAVAMVTTFFAAAGTTAASRNSADALPPYTLHSSSLES